MVSVQARIKNRRKINGSKKICYRCVHCRWIPTPSVLHLLKPSVLQFDGNCIQCAEANAQRVKAKRKDNHLRQLYLNQLSAPSPTKVVSYVEVSMTDFLFNRLGNEFSHQLSNFFPSSKLRIKVIQLTEDVSNNL